MNNPLHQLGGGGALPVTQRQRQSTQSGVSSSNMGVTSLTRLALRLQLAFRAAGWLNLRHTNKISTEDALKCQVQGGGEGGTVRRVELHWHFAGDKAKSSHLCQTIKYFVMVIFLRLKVEQHHFLVFNIQRLRELYRKLSLLGKKNSTMYRTSGVMAHMVLPTIHQNPGFLGLWLSLSPETSP